MIHNSRTPFVSLIQIILYLSMCGKWSSRMFRIADPRPDPVPPPRENKHKKPWSWSHCSTECLKRFAILSWYSFPCAWNPSALKIKWLKFRKIRFQAEPFYLPDFNKNLKFFSLSEPPTAYPAPCTIILYLFDFLAIQIKGNGKQSLRLLLSLLFSFFIFLFHLSRFSFYIKLFFTYLGHIPPTLLGIFSSYWGLTINMLVPYGDSLVSFCKLFNSHFH